MPGILDSLIKYHDFLKNENGVTTLINSRLWNEEILSFNQDGTFYILYFLHVDDWGKQPSWPQSSSILGVYYSFPSAPEILRSN